MAYYACRNCKKPLKQDAITCPSCETENPHQRCRVCQKIVPMGVPKCPSCKAKAPLLSKRLMLFRSFIFPIAVVILFALLIALKH